MQTVRDLLTHKGSQVWVISPRATVFEALRLMAEKGVGALVVVDHERAIGIFSERDYARKIILQGKGSRNTAVREIMSNGLVTVGPDQSLHSCIQLMNQHHIRHLPVIEHTLLAGMISIRDVMNALLAEIPEPSVPASAPPEENGDSPA